MHFSLRSESKRNMIKNVLKMLQVKIIRTRLRPEDLFQSLNRKTKKNENNIFYAGHNRFCFGFVILNSRNNAIVQI